MSDLNPNPHLAVVTAGIELRGLKQRLSKLQASIDILATRKAPHVDEMRMRAEILRMQIDTHRRLLSEIQTNGYEWYRENYEDIARRYEEGDGLHSGGEEPHPGGTEGDAGEAQADTDGASGSVADACSEERTAEPSP